MIFKTSTNIWQFLKTGISLYFFNITELFKSNVALVLQQATDYLFTLCLDQLLVL